VALQDHQAVTVELCLAEDGDQRGIRFRIGTALGDRLQARLGDRGVGAHHALDVLGERVPLVRRRVQRQRHHRAGDEHGGEDHQDEQYPPGHGTLP
jgi:hypothetical protein